MYAHYSNYILLDFHYLQRQMNGLTKLQPFKLSHHGDTTLDSWPSEYLLALQLPIIIYQCKGVRSWNIAQCVCHEFFHLLRYRLSSMHTSVLDKGDIFTEQRSSVNPFVTATSNNSYNSKTNLSMETKQRFSNALWIGEHDDPQGLLIRAFIHRLLR